MRILQSIFISLIYWVPSSMVLFDVITDDGVLFPSWIDAFLAPGYLLGLAFGFAGGTAAAVAGQLITLAILTALVYHLINYRSRRRNSL